MLCCVVPTWWNAFEFYILKLMQTHSKFIYLYIYLNNKTATQSYTYSTPVPLLAEYIKRADIFEIPYRVNKYRMVFYSL